MPNHRNTIDDFFKKVSKPRLKNNCWIWIGAKDKDGYGRFGSYKIWGNAHKASYIFHKGIIPKGMCVLHTCDNPSCVNPKHLWLGTNKDNMQDKIKKGRFKNNKGQPHSEERKRNISLSKKGCIPWNKGKKLSIK